MDQDPSWDEASIELIAECDGDSIRFTIMNIGTGDMEAPLGFIVIEGIYWSDNTWSDIIHFKIISNTLEYMPPRAEQN